MRKGGTTDKPYSQSLYRREEGKKEGTFRAQAGMICVACIVSWNFGEMKQRRSVEMPTFPRIGHECGQPVMLREKHE